MVFGATGYTGRLVAERLLAAGHASGARRALRGEAARAGRAARRARVGGRRRAPRDVDVRSRPPRRRAGLDGRAVRALGRARGARRGGRRRRATWTRRASRRSSAACSPSSTRRRATRARSLLTAMGYDFVPGALAAGLALREAGEGAVRVDVGYYALGGGPSSMSRGTRASIAGHRARALLRLPRRRRAHRALGGADALLRREGQAAAGRSPSAAPSTSRSRRSSTTCARSTSTSAGSARSRAGSRRPRA